MLELPLDLVSFQILLVESFSVTCGNIDRFIFSGDIVGFPGEEGETGLLEDGVCEEIYLSGGLFVDFM